MWYSKVSGKTGRVLNFCWLFCWFIYSFWARLQMVDFLDDCLLFCFIWCFLSCGINLLNKKGRTGIYFTFIILPLLILLADIFFSLPRLVLGANLFIIIYCVWLGFIILKRTFLKGHINVHRIEGAIVVYLLTALIFAPLYHSVFLLNGQYAFRGLSNYERSEFMYFSLTTLQP